MKVKNYYQCFQKWNISNEGKQGKGLKIVTPEQIF